MIVKPKIRSFVCITSHPTGCAAHIDEQIAIAKAAKKTDAGPKNVLVIGASTGYGLSTRISAAFTYGAKTLGIFFERPSSTVNLHLPVGIIALLLRMQPRPKVSTPRVSMATLSPMR